MHKIFVCVCDSQDTPEQNEKEIIYKVTIDIVIGNQHKDRNQQISY